MDFYEILPQVIDLLQREERVSYRVLRRQFSLDDDFLEDLKEELIYSKRLAVDEDNRVLVWTGSTETSPAPGQLTSHTNTQVAPTSQAGASLDVHTPDAERRQLTVMFCDLVESTQLSSQLDPEELREVIRSYQATCDTVIQRFDGHVAQYLGDGLLIYFGYPQAHEDDAQRAVRAGLGMVDAIAALNTQLSPEKGVRLAVRLGIHTGLVVVGEMGGESKQEQLALGETPNVAARLQGFARADTVVMSEATHRLVQGYFECQALGEHTLRGVSGPMAVY